MIQTPQVRPGKVEESGPMPRVVVYFPNSAQGNLAIQIVTGMGVPSDQLGVTPPDRIEGGQGMVLSIPCPDPTLVPKIEKLCRDFGAQIHRQSR